MMQKIVNVLLTLAFLLGFLYVLHLVARAKEKTESSARARVWSMCNLGRAKHIVLVV